MDSLLINISTKYTIEYIVVDNNSSDGSFPFLSDRFGDKVTFIKSDKNLGFGKACNIGASNSSGRYLLFLNPDTLVPDGTLENCIEFLDKKENNRIGALGIKLLDGKGEFLLESKRSFPSVTNAFFKLSGLSSLFPKVKLFNKYNFSYLQPDKSSKVEVLCGAFMIIKEEVFSKVNGFDEDFFMYGEDIDLCYRINKLGRDIYYFADENIIHFKGESSKRKDYKYFSSFYKAMSIYANKHFNPFAAFLLKIAIYIASLLAIGMTRIKSIIPVLLDLISFIAVLNFLKILWSKFYFNNTSYYSDINFLIFSCGMSLVFIITLCFTGRYRNDVSLRNILFGVIIGALVVFSVYGFLPLNWRFSRLILLLFAPLAFVSIIINSVLVQFINTGKWSLFSYHPKRLAYVGNARGKEDLEKLISLTQANLDFVGCIYSDEDVEVQDKLGHIEQISDLIDIYKLDEIVFSASDEQFQHIFELLNKHGNKVKFKVLSSDGNSIVGSAEPGIAGDLYLADLTFKISNTTSIYLKRTFDIIFGLLFLILFPITFTFKKQLIRKSAKVILGRLTWVGYIETDNKLAELPRLKKGVTSLNNKIGAFKLNQKHIHTFNLRYAKNYSVFVDLDIILKYIFKPS